MGEEGEEGKERVRARRERFRRASALRKGVGQEVVRTTSCNSLSKPGSGVGVSQAGVGLLRSRSRLCPGQRLARRRRMRQPTPRLLFGHASRAPKESGGLDEKEEPSPPPFIS